MNSSGYCLNCCYLTIVLNIFENRLPNINFFISMVIRIFWIWPLHDWFSHAAAVYIAVVSMPLFTVQDRISHTMTRMTIIPASSLSIICILYVHWNEDKILKNSNACRLIYGSLAVTNCALFKPFAIQFFVFIRGKWPWLVIMWRHGACTKYIIYAVFNLMEFAVILFLEIDAFLAIIYNCNCYHDGIFAVP